MTRPQVLLPESAEGQQTRANSLLTSRMGTGCLRRGAPEGSLELQRDIALIDLIHQSQTSEKGADVVVRVCPAESRLRTGHLDR